MLTDENLDEPSLPDDILASYAEIFGAVEEARTNPEVNSRLLLAAKFIHGASKKLKRTCEPEDLLQDAIEAILDGRRKWPKNRVDFKGLVVGVMRSMVSSRDKTIAAKHPDITMEHELHPVGDTQETPNLEEISGDSLTTEEVVLRKEQETIEECRMAILCAQYAPDSIHRKILQKVGEGYSTQAEIYEALGMEESVFRNAWKALMRAATRFNDSAKE